MVLSEGAAWEGDMESSAGICCRLIPAPAASEATHARRSANPPSLNTSMTGMDQKARLAGGFSRPRVDAVASQEGNPRTQRVKPRRPLLRTVCRDMGLTQTSPVKTHWPFRLHLPCNNKFRAPGRQDSASDGCLVPIDLASEIMALKAVRPFDPGQAL